MNEFNDREKELSRTAYPLGETDDKLIIYQLLVRLFGNKQTKLHIHGSLAENGVGKLNDLNDAALKAFRQMGITHVWYTGLIEHASLTDYSRFDISPDHPAVVKGQAGSPYAIKDYYDVHPDLAEDVPQRMAEFELLVDRTHRHGLNVIIDFVPNHVARSYHSDAKPTDVSDLGAHDQLTEAFHPQNNFYYLPGQAFVPPNGYQPFGPDKKIDPTLNPYTEIPAKVTGNDVFSAHPGINDWFETIKLNYGVDIQHDYQQHFEPTPDTWQKMYDILAFWASKGVDGFRCDMVHLVPIEFWAWVIPKVKAKYPAMVFIGEIYDPQLYQAYIHQAKFDYLYDKVGLYDHLRKLMNIEESTRNIHRVLHQSEGMADRMLRFLENHDEQRIASPQFAADPWKAIPAMTISATLSRGPVMIYFGQEVGESAAGASGFSGDDGRTTLFDYWSVPEHQKWMNNGLFDGAQLAEEQEELRDFYVRLLNLCRANEAIRNGHFYELPAPNISEPHPHLVYSFLRHTEHQQILVMANFSPDTPLKVPVFIPEHAWQVMQKDPFNSYILQDLLFTDTNLPLKGGMTIDMPPLSASVFELREVGSLLKSH